MNSRIVVSSALALALSLSAIHPSLSQSESSATSTGVEFSNRDWAKYVTVLAIAPDGTWGAATDLFTNPAISRAIANCKLKHLAGIGCGYRSVTMRAGWILSYRCGDRNIIVADKDLAGAKRTAIREEGELRARYVPNLPRCEQVVAIDPDGLVLVPALAYAASPQSSP